MLSWLRKTIATVVLIVAGSVALWYYRDQTSSQRQIVQLEQEKHVLEQVVQRLSDEKRVAEAIVTDQKMINGSLHSTILFVEYDRDGKTLPPRKFEVIGATAHIDALVIKFDRHFVSEADPLRGHSVALFTRIYGDEQVPADAYLIDPPGQIPAIYRNEQSAASEFEIQLWKDFWKLADDQAFRDSKGIRVANGQGVWGPFEPEKLYTITLESDGGLNITSEPLKGIYRELLREHTAEAAATQR